MRTAVLISMGFVMTNGTVLIAAHTLADGLSERWVDRNAETLGAIAFVVGFTGVVAECVGLLPLVQAWLVGVTARLRTSPRPLPATE